MARMKSEWLMKGSNMSTKILPEGYRLAEKITMKKNIILSIGLTVSAVLMAVLSVIILLFIIPMKFSGGFSITITGIFPLLFWILGMIFVITIHEFVHGFFIHFFTKDKVKYGFHGVTAFAGTDYYFNKKEYILTALAPFIFLNFIIIIILFFLNGAMFLAIYFILVVHLSGCVGDLYIVIKLLKYKLDTLIKDSGIEMEFWEREK